jgi:hypothetical protein
MSDGRAFHGLSNCMINNALLNETNLEPFDQGGYDDEQYSDL